MLICKSIRCGFLLPTLSFSKILTWSFKNVAQIWLFENIPHGIDLILSAQGLTCVHVRDASLRWLWYIGNLLLLGRWEVKMTQLLSIFSTALVQFPFVEAPADSVSIFWLFLCWFCSNDGFRDTCSTADITDFHRMPLTSKAISGTGMGLDEPLNAPLLIAPLCVLEFILDYTAVVVLGTNKSWMCITLGTCKYKQLVCLFLFVENIHHTWAGPKGGFAKVGAQLDISCHAPLLQASPLYKR